MEFIVPGITPPLDEGFRPAVLANHNFQHKVKTVGVRAVIGLERGAPEQRATILTACADAADGTPGHFLYRTVRDRAKRVHYADPSTWGPLRFAHPPQPRGYPHYWTAPRA